MLFECMGICILSPAYESEMRGYLVYVLIVKYLSHRFFFKLQLQYMRLDGLIVELCVCVCGGVKTFLAGSVDHVIYSDYTVNRRFFIYCSLACVSTITTHSQCPEGSNVLPWLGFCPLRVSIVM